MSQIEWVRGNKVGSLRDGERVRVQWPNRDALLTGQVTMEWREGVYHGESRSIRLDGGAVIAPPKRDGYEVEKTRPRARRLAAEEAPLLFELAPDVPSSAGRAELHDSLRPQRARKVRPRPPEYRFWQEVREGDRVLVDGLLEGVVEDTGVHVEKGEVVRIVNYSVVRLDGGDTIEVQDHARMKRVPEET